MAGNMSIRFSDLERAILQTVAYADVFDYPLTVMEIHRYLVGVPAALEDVRVALVESSRLRERLAQRDGYIFLAGREEIVAVRRHRQEVAKRLWTWARHYARIVSGLPFVRMVAVTGSLAVNNADEDGDIDYLIVTAPGRLWLCRALVVTLVKWAHRQGVTLCPNYFLSEQALAVEPHNLFTARELTQMQPLCGLSVYEQMREINAWTDAFLPNAQGPPPTLNGGAAPNRDVHSHRVLRRAAEMILRTPIGAKVEQWEMNRKIAKFRIEYPASDEAAFSPDWCKGHFDGHAHRILDAYSARLEGS